MGEATTSRSAARKSRRIRSVVANSLLVIFLVSVVWVFWPSTLGGCSTFTIVSGKSMEPTYYTDDLVWARCGEYAVGDVVIYEPLTETKAQVIHRIIGGSSEQGWQIQGDNNNFIDPWNPTDDQVLGKALVHIPNLGNVIQFVSSPIVWTSVLVIAGGLLLWPAKAGRRSKHCSETDESDVDEPLGDDTDADAAASGASSSSIDEGG